ncbi:MAG: cation-translocating P-type ATPase [Verrucomicrobia bacterium]|nr:cation-translocating P-type ATPase [Verrucomicrobiota bacterium]
MKVSLFRIRGLDCAEEVNALRAAVGRIPGVEVMDFDLLNGVMKVTGAEELADAVVLAAVKKAGLEGARIGPIGQNSPAKRFAPGRLFACVISGGATSAGFVVHAWMAGGVMAALAEKAAFPPVARALYAAAILAAGWHVAPRAWASARRLRPDMNLLMTLAVLGAAAIGQWFEAATVSFLFTLALWLESWSVGRARRAIRALMDLAPPVARVVGPRDGKVEEKPVEAIQPDSRVVVRPGERIPLDGVVIEGATTVNQAPITGESAPVSKRVGDEVFAGTINHDGAFTFRVTRPSQDTLLARILRMVEEARSRRAPVEQWVDRFARFYTPVMFGLAALVCVGPPLAGVGTWGEWFYRGLVLLVIACPCALVISTPVSLVAALTAAAHAGVLVKGGAFLEAAGRLKAIALDKTGTLTVGRPEVQRVIPLDGHTPGELLATAAALETHSEHPLARAILRRAQDDGVAPRTATAFRALPGRGAEAEIEGRRYWIGSHRLLHDEGGESAVLHDQLQTLEDEGHSVIAVGNGRHVCGVISVSEGIRPGAVEAIRELRALGVQHVAVLTGDNQGTAEAVARVVGADECRAELLPGDKHDAVRELAGRYKTVAMAGDGVNDAPALAAATIGIAMGAAGTDAALETADIALMTDDLSRLPWLVRHSRRTLRIVRQNIFVALGAKGVFMALAAAGRATLWMAIAADMGASLLVIFNGLRLLKR